MRCLLAGIVFVLPAICGAVAVGSPNPLFPIRRNNLTGFMDLSGAVIIAPKFQAARNFSEGLAAMQSGEQWGYIDSTGAITIPPRFVEAKAFSQGRAAVKLDNSTATPWHYIGPNGVPICDAGFDEAGSFSDGFAVVKRAGQFLYIDEECKPAFVSAPKFDDAAFFSGGLARVEINHLYGYIDKTGKIAVAPRFQAADSFSEGLAAVSISKDKWGYIDPTGNIAIAPQFSFASAFSSGLAYVILAGRAKKKGYGFIDKQGHIVIAPRFKEALGFSDGLAPVAVTDPYDPPPTGAGGEAADPTRWGFINTNGDWVISPHFLIAEGFGSGVTMVVAAVSLDSYYIDTKGKRIAQFSDTPLILASEGFVNENVFVSVSLASSPPGATVYGIPLFEWESNKDLPNIQDKLAMYQIIDPPGVTPLRTSIPRETFIFVFKLNTQVKTVKKTIVVGQPAAIEVVFQ